MRNFLFTCLCSLISFGAFASNAEIESFLKEFHSNPEKMIYQLPPEVRDGKTISRGFLNSEILSKDLFEEKRKIRDEIRNKAERSFSLRSAIADTDDPGVLMDGGVVLTNILELDRKGLMNAKVPQKMWSDTYWPISKGLIAARYADGHPDTHDWSSNYNHYVSNPTETVSTDVLSPAEKYDLLVGDSSKTMTRFSWNNGQNYNQIYGHVPTWMGICHGWSAATHMLAPITWAPIKLKAFDGRDLTFYQSDVKALVSMLWAKADVPTRFLGLRCEKTPPRDGQGRTVDDDCFDTNPGTFFLALTNQLGLHKRSFVMDSQYDAEVWNFAIESYRGTFFNPQSFQQTDNLRAAMIPVGKFTIDKFRQHRTPGTAYVVGVVMDVTHLNETSPSQSVQLKNATKTVRYIYDLELDANHQVIGGEWYQRAHPDFLWSYSQNAQAVAPGDYDINPHDWNITRPVPAGWTEAARKSSRDGIPLYSVLKKIVEASPKPPMEAQ